MKKMIKIPFIVLACGLVLLAGVFYFVRSDPSNNFDPQTIDSPSDQGDNSTTTQEKTPPEKKEGLVAPLDRPEQRITEKPFGIFITPENSPIKDERFSGYHTGVDWEAFDSEIGEEVPVKVVCTGEIVSKRNVSGYGGTAVQECRISGDPVTVIYGHLDLGSIEAETGSVPEAGEALGNLGEHKSEETDGERKHLHLGIHKGGEEELRGYVDSEEELSSWIDPCLYVCGE